MHRTLLLVSLLLAAPAAHADVVTVPAELDGTLFNDLSGNTANGSGPILIVGRAGGASTAPIRRIVVRFDVAALVPAGATINSANLVLANTAGNTGARTVELHRVLATWNEGGSDTTSGQGAQAQAGDATWLHRSFPSVFWQQPGGDFDATISAQLSVDAFGTYTWPSTPRVVQDVQGWLDQPASSAGWLLKLDVETVPNTTKVFGSRESVAAGERPQLVIDYTPAVTVYCTAQVNSAGCTPAIGASGLPSASAGGGFSVTLAQALNRKAGVLAYGFNGPASTPFLGGLLCVAPPLNRTSVLNTGGSLVGVDCSGSFVLDFNARIASGVDPALVAGAVVHAQWHTRDPGNTAGSFNSSDALRIAIGL
jgi:hypothetical protein